MSTFVDRHAAKILGVLSYFDRVVIIGTLSDICHAGAMAQYLRSRARSSSTTRGSPNPSATKSASTQTGWRASMASRSAPFRPQFYFNAHNGNP